MEKHHRESIDLFLNLYKNDTSILAVILAGSIAHGFEGFDSDIDLCLIVDDDEYSRRKQSGTLAFSLKDICTYQNGYIDCKVIDIDFLSKVLKNGSDPARFAFKNNIILYSQVEDLKDLLNRITAFPVVEKDSRRKRFASQLLAWQWYYSEGIKKKNSYLVYLAIQKIILFSCRLVLNENEMLYPYHKWLLRLTGTAQNRPEKFMFKIEDLLSQHSEKKVNDFCSAVIEFHNISENDIDWPNYFLRDSERNWLYHEPPVDDL